MTTGARRHLLPLVLAGAGLIAFALSATAQEDCTTCHEDVAKQFPETVHGRTWAADKSYRSPTCVREVGLRGSRSVEDYREVIGTMLVEADRLSRLADDLLLLARAETGKAQLRFEPVDLSALAEEVSDRLSVLAEERRQTLQTRVDGPVIVSGDRPTLRQALLILVDNAIKYSPEATRVLVRVGRDSDRAWVEVKDEGPGIPPEDRDRIFERFYRIDASRSREMGWTRPRAVSRQRDRRGACGTRRAGNRERPRQPVPTRVTARIAPREVKLKEDRVGVVSGEASSRPSDRDGNGGADRDRTI